MENPIILTDSIDKDNEKNNIITNNVNNKSISSSNPYLLNDTDDDTLVAEEETNTHFGLKHPSVHSIMIDSDDDHFYESDENCMENDSGSESDNE